MDKTLDPGAFEFFEKVALIIEQARRHIGRTTDTTMCVAYFEIGRLIVEEEQGGKARAAYGKRLLAGLSMFLRNRVGKGYSETTLRNARKFYQVYSPSIQQALLAESGERARKPIQQAMLAELEDVNGKVKRHAMLGEIADGEKPSKSQAMLTIFAKNGKRQAMLDELHPFNLSWSHYLVLMRIKNDDERRFYEIEAIKQNWDYRWLHKQYAGSLYERLALSTNKEKVVRLASEGQVVDEPRDILKNPLVLDFLDLEERPEYSETDMVTAIISKLQYFLLELGKGFLFEARQKRFTFNEKHYKVDLVCYNRLLRCYVLIDIKTDPLEHRDLGQMMMYVHYFDRHVKTDDERPTVGILLCKEKDDAIVELTLPEGENIYASEYSLYLPDKSTLQSKLAEWIEEFEETKALRELENGGDSE